MSKFNGTGLSDVQYRMLEKEYHINIDNLKVLDTKVAGDQYIPLYTMFSSSGKLIHVKDVVGLSNKMPKTPSGTKKALINDYNKSEQNLYCEMQNGDIEVLPMYDEINLKRLIGSEIMYKTAEGRIEKLLQDPMLCFIRAWEEYNEL